MRNLRFTPTNKSNNFGSTTVKVNASEFNRAMDKAQKDLKESMYKATGDAFSYAKSRTEAYLYGLAGIEPLAKRVADSLDYEKNQLRKNKIKINDEGVEMNETMFGSRGPHPRGQLGGEGVHTEPDDTQGTYQIAVALQEGRSAKSFKFDGSRGSNGSKGGAQVHGRQVGRSGGPTEWYGKGANQPYFYGFMETDFLGYAERAFRARFDSAMKRAMKRKLE